MKLAYKRLYSAVIVVGLTACAGPEERGQANYGFAYLEQHLSENPLVLPSGLDAPQLSKEYLIPTLKLSDTPPALGPQIDIRAPVQVLTLVPNSQAEQSPQPQLVFAVPMQQKNLSRPLRLFWEEYFKQHGVNIQATTELSFETDWFKTTTVLDGWAKEHEDYQIQQRYRLEFTENPAARTVTQKVTLLEHRQTPLKQVKPALSAEKQQRYSALLLNDFSRFYVQQQQQATINAAKQSMTSQLIEDNNGLPAILIEAPFDQAWLKMQPVLSLHGFKITEQQPSLGVFDVSYEQPKAEYWAKRQLTAPSLPSGQYRFQLGESPNNTTTVTLFDKKNKPLRTRYLKELYPSINAELLINAPQ